jgi:hypothetical protein
MKIYKIERTGEQVCVDCLFSEQYDSKMGALKFPNANKVLKAIRDKFGPGKYLLRTVYSNGRFGPSRIVPYRLISAPGVRTGDVEHWTEFSFEGKPSERSSPEWFPRSCDTENICRGLRDCGQPKKTIADPKRRRVRISE